MALQTGRHYRGAARRPESGDAQRLANGLGWFSLGLGLAEIVAPEKIAQMAGLPQTGIMAAMIRSSGFREIAAGIGILSRPAPVGWMWGRVAGDMLDLVLVDSAMASKETDRTRAALASGVLLGVSALDLYCLQELRRTALKDGRVRETRTIIINRPPEAVYSFWRRFENFPKFMSNLESVRLTGDGRSHWKARGPAGKTVEWHSEIVTDHPNSLIAWRSVEDSDIYNSGSVRFERATGGRGTLVRLNLEYDPPGGPIAADIARLLGAEPGQQAGIALRLMKQILETGDIVRSEAGIRSGMHAAQPPEEQADTGAWAEGGETTRKEGKL